MAEWGLGGGSPNTLASQPCRWAGVGGELGGDGDRLESAGSGASGVTGLALAGPEIGAGGGGGGCGAYTTG